MTSRSLHIGYISGRIHGRWYKNWICVHILCLCVNYYLRDLQIACSCAVIVIRLYQHWGRDKIARRHFQMHFEWKCMIASLLNLFLRVQLTTFEHWFKYWLGAGQATSHCLNQCWLIHWHICVTRPRWVNWNLSIYRPIDTLVNPFFNRASAIEIDLSP